MIWRAWPLLLLGMRLCADESASAYLLRDGSRLDARDVERREGALVVTLTDAEDEGVVEQVHAVADVMRLDWPEPPKLAEARACIDAGNTQGALDCLDVVLVEFRDFPATPGSWWREAAVLRARTLVAAERGAEAVPWLQRVLAHQPPAPVEATIRLLFVEIDLLAGRLELAVAMLDQVAELDELEPASRAQMAVLRGRIHLRQKRWEAALEAFLEVPAFYGRERHLRPAVLWGSGEAYARRGDRVRAARAYRELVREWPDHPLAARARAALDADAEDW